MLEMKFAFIVGSIIILIIEVIRFAKRNKEEKFFGFREFMTLIFRFYILMVIIVTLFPFSNRWVYRRTIYEYCTSF